MSFSSRFLLGKPLFVDATTSSFSRSNVARVCVEVDLLKTIPLRVWVDMGDGDGFWQALIPENLPKYCSHCYRQGHGEDQCRVKHPALRVPKPHEGLAAGMRGEVGVPSSQANKESEGERQGKVTEVAAVVQSGALQVMGKGQAEGQLLGVVSTTTPSPAVEEIHLPTHGQQPGSVAALVEEGIESTADAIIHALADRVIDKPEKELIEAAHDRELALGVQAVGAGTNMEAASKGEGPGLQFDSHKVGGSVGRGDRRLQGLKYRLSDAWELRS